jgi:hypothetical protein
MEAHWVWDPASKRYCWWDGTRYTIWASRAGAGWTYSSATDRIAAVHFHRFGIGAAVAVGGLLLAFSALLIGTDPGPGEDIDTGTLTGLLLAGGTVFVVGVVVAAVELIRGLRKNDATRRSR